MKCAEKGCGRATEDGRRYCTRCYDRRVPSREARLRAPDPTGHTSIPCAVCGKLLRTVRNHTQVHGLTLAGYRERFPDAPVTCGELRGIHLDLWIDRGGEVYTREMVVRALRAWAAKRKRTPSAREWRRTPSGPGHPSGPTIDKLFGSWGAALAAADLPPIQQRYNGGARPKRVCLRGHRKPLGKNCPTCHAERQRRYYHEAKNSSGPRG